MGEIMEGWLANTTGLFASCSCMGEADGPGRSDQKVMAAPPLTSKSAKTRRSSAPDLQVSLRVEVALPQARS
jgi:hypothetical protein